MSLWVILTMPYVMTYPPDGYNYIKLRQNGDAASNDSYLFHPLTIISSFLGLPNRDLGGEGKQSLLNLLKNFIGWIDGTAWWRIGLNLIKLMPITLWHLFTVILRFASHVIKLVTEFIPFVCKMAMNYVSATCGQHINKLLSEPVKLSPFRVISLLVCGALYIVAQAGCIVFGLIYLVGRAVTSPHKSVQIAWHYGQSLCGANATGYLLSGFLSMLSIATTMLVYGLIFPIALKYLAVIVLPHLPVPLLAATHFVSSHVLPVFSIAGKAILMPVLGPVFRLFGVGVSPAIVSLSVISGLVVSTIGTVIKRTLERFKTWRHQCTKKTMEESVPARTEVSIDCYQRPALDRDERPAELDSQKKWASFQSQSTSKLTPGFFFARTPDRQSETPLPPQCSM